jgi:hypothetical protein
VRVLLDESLPVDLAAELPGHDVATVRSQAWTGLLNGELLRRARGAFDVFITMDQSLPHQQNLAVSQIAVVLIRARSNRLSDLRPVIPQLLAAIAVAKPGEVQRVGA